LKDLIWKWHATKEHFGLSATLLGFGISSLVSTSGQGQEIQNQTLQNQALCRILSERVQDDKTAGRRCLSYVPRESSRGVGRKGKVIKVVYRGET